MFVIWSCIRIQGKVLHELSWFQLRSIVTDRSSASPLLLVLFVLASVVSYVATILSLFAPDLLFIWFPEKSVLFDCGISLEPLLMSYNLIHTQKDTLSY